MLIQFEKSSNATGFLNVKRILIKSIVLLLINPLFYFDRAQYTNATYLRKQTINNIKSMLQ